MGLPHEPCRCEKIRPMTVGVKVMDGYYITTRVTIDALREQVSRVENEFGMQVSQLDAELGTITDANTNLLTQLAKAFLLLGSQRDMMDM